jgi:hypothetical protein
LQSWKEIILDKGRRNGIEIAVKDKSKYKGRKPIEYNKVLFDKLYKEWKAEEITAKIFMEKINLKANTFYRQVKLYNI